MQGKTSISNLLLMFSLVAVFSIGGRAQNSEPFECVRATPERVIKRSVFPGTTFVLRKNKEFPFNDLGFETVKLTDGEKLIVEHGGCETYALTFRFETKRLSEKNYTAAFWYREAVRLMRQTKKGYGSNFLLDGGVKALNSRLKSKKPLRYAETLDFGGTEIRSVVTLNRVSKLKGNKYQIEIAFGTGPL